MNERPPAGNEFPAGGLFSARGGCMLVDQQCSSLFLLKKNVYLYLSYRVYSGRREVVRHKQQYLQKHLPRTSRNSLFLIKKRKIFPWIWAWRGFVEKISPNCGSRRAVQEIFCIYISKKMNLCQKAAGSRAGGLFIARGGCMLVDQQCSSLFLLEKRLFIFVISRI